ncbi:Protein AAGR-1 [Aphelenchoides avenae]|nr:Protein AAGR-1 [Aphelenchus avenae]
MWRLGGLCLLALAAQCIVTSSQTVDPSSRVDCWPQPNPDKNACIKRGCWWDNNAYPHASTTPLCYYPANTGYVVKSSAKNGDGEDITLMKAPGSVKNPYDPDIEPLTFSYRRIGAGYRISIGTKGRYVPPVPINWNPDLKSEDRLFLSVKRGSTFSFQVRRHTTGQNIWDTSIGGLLFGDRYIQIATFLPTDRVYGFGENIHQQLKHDLSKYTTWGMFARDYAPDSYTPNTENLYGK